MDFTFSEKTEYGKHDPIRKRTEASKYPKNIQQHSNINNMEGLVGLSILIVVVFVGIIVITAFENRNYFTKTIVRSTAAAAAIGESLEEPVYDAESGGVHEAEPYKKSLWEKVTEFFKTLWEKVTEFFKKRNQVYPEIDEEVPGPVAQAVEPCKKSLWEKVTEFFKTLAEKVKQNKVHPAGPVGEAREEEETDCYTGRMSRSCLCVVFTVVFCWLLVFVLDVTHVIDATGE